MGTASVDVALPVPAERAWALLGDTGRMVRLDPALESYEPANGFIEEGSCNRLTIRVGPWRATMTTRTAVLDPPGRAVFVTVVPSHPIRVRTEDLLTPIDDERCRYTVTVSATPTLR